MKRRHAPQYDENKTLNKKIKLDTCYYPSNLNLLAKRVMMIAYSPFLNKDVSTVIGYLMYLSDFKIYLIQYKSVDCPLLLNPYESILNAVHIIVTKYKTTINKINVTRLTWNYAEDYIATFYPNQIKIYNEPITSVRISDDRLYLEILIK